MLINSTKININDYDPLKHTFGQKYLKNDPIKIHR